MSRISLQNLWEKYQVVRVLGKGSFGKVFLIRDIQNNVTQYAMKKYSKYHLTTNGKQKSLIRSIKIISILNHKNIIKLLKYTFSETQDSMFLMFEPCKKGSLQQLKTGIFKTKDIDLLTCVIYQLIEGLYYLKTMSVAHRDIKPSNVTFNSKGQLKIIDFDEAICFKPLQKQNTQSQDQQQINFPFSEQPINKVFTSRRSNTNSFVGTQIYMAPQMKLTTKTDQRGDIWALGCILFQMIFNQSLQLAFDQQDQLTEEVQNKLGYIRKSNQQLNFDCMDLLQKILVINPDKRISIDEIIQHHFFNKIKLDENYRLFCYEKLKKFLRGNYCIYDPINVYDALQIDLIGMKDGQQRCQMLKSVIYLKKENQYMLNFIIGGAKYFKLFNVQNQSDKIYLWYDSIDKVYIKDDHLYINIKSESWSKQKNNFQIAIKHLYPQMLGRLNDMIGYIIRD